MASAQQLANTLNRKNIAKKKENRALHPLNNEARHSFAFARARNHITWEKQMEFTRKLRQSTCILFNIFLVLKRKPIGHAKKSTKNYFKSEISPLNSKRMSLFFADSGSLLTIYE